MLSTLKSRNGGGDGLKKVRIEKKFIDDKYSLKNLIFMPSKPTYVIPTDLQGHKVFVCVDCGDKFVCESSYNYHVNRRSVKITYTCRTCSKTMVYMNRCNLLSHIRSHVFKTTTINLIDLKLEPLPMEDMLFGLFHLNQPLTLDEVLKNEESIKAQNQLQNDNGDNISPEVSVNVEEDSAVVEENAISKTKRMRRYKCPECNELLPLTNSKGEARYKHFTKPCPSGNTYNCIICPFVSSNMCALKAHYCMHSRIGMRTSFCPECGDTAYRRHGCSGFKFINSFTFLYCPVKECGELIDSKSFYSHFSSNHIKLVYRCSLCDTAFTSESSLHSHIRSKHAEQKEIIQITVYHQCMLCPKRLVLNEFLDSHIMSHKTVAALIYPCKKCGYALNNIGELLTHSEICTETNRSNEQLCRVTKQCQHCNKSTVYQCFQSHVGYLPFICLDNCSGKLVSKVIEPIEFNGFNTPVSNTNTDDSQRIKCPLCKIHISIEWNEIKIHFDSHHKVHRCIDVKLELERINPKNIIVKTKTLKRKSTNSNEKRVKKRKLNNNIQKLNNQKPEQTQANEPENKLRCRKCHEISIDTKSFRKHILSHRDPSMAYQCMECGSCYVVKPSFCTHLFVAHGIQNADQYIESNDCFNPDAFKDKTELEPVKPNQCRICREQFDAEEDLGKHFRVHGMAFLLTKRRRR